jgi:hypothetical protein
MKSFGWHKSIPEKNGKEKMTDNQRGCVSGRFPIISFLPGYEVMYLGMKLCVCLGMKVIYLDMKVMYLSMKFCNWVGSFVT